MQTGDPYLTFAKLAGLAPEDATKHSHRAIRDACKACVLGANYGMQASTLAYRIGRPRADAELLLRSLERTFPVFARWTEQVIDRGTLTGRLSSVFGWPQRFSLVPT